MIGSRSVYNLAEPKGATLLNLGKFPAGGISALDYIPKDSRGFYAWFRSYDYPENPDCFVERLLEDIAAPKFAPRQGFVSPYHQVEIASGGDMTPGRKDALKKAIKNPEFFAALQSGRFCSNPLFTSEKLLIYGTALSPTFLLRAHYASDWLPLD
jgi:hypothetical protein